MVAPLLATASVADPDPGSGSYFLELRNHFLGLKYLNSLMRIRDGDIRIRDPGWNKVGSGINITDPHHWLRQLSGLESRHLSKIQNGDICKRVANTR